MNRQQTWSIFRTIMESHTIVRAISESKNSHFQNEANCKMSENEFYLRENKKSFSYRWFRT